MKRRVLTWQRLSVLLALGLLLAYWAWPRVGIWLIPLEDGDETWAEDFTFAAGTRAIGPMIDCIRNRYNGIDKAEAGWVQVLRRFGEPAHQALWQAASQERDPSGRTRLIIALGNAFEDYRMLPVAVNDLLSSRIPLSFGSALTWPIQRSHHGVEVPPVADFLSKKLNGDFIRWWNSLSDAQKIGESAAGMDATGRPPPATQPG